MSRQLDAVAFDLDGTLVDTMTMAPMAYVETIRELGGPELTPGDVTRVWNMGPTAAVLGHFLGRPAESADLDRFYRTFEAAVRTVVAFDGVIDMLDALAERGYALGVYTTATRRAADAMLANAGLVDRRLVVVAGDDVTEPKPHPEGLRRLCRQLDADPRLTAYVGDSEVDALCANAARSLAIHAAWGAPRAQGRAERAEGADRADRVRIDSATSVARTPADVVDIVLAASTAGGGTGVGSGAE